ncbi:mediator complex subunit MED18 [Toxoplasma gondii ME49]|uniref:Mediator complex subunit MED18 n=2 Tax=Toxoplasma gondii TaxID=5811 RepID=B6KP77_TOXGV|nr:mediator complex subunit MED18 [Toxoplasma gondii ME49]EPT32368.1 mediator complex subunit MED18 [Toxoplasma gondii ME49]ESS29483.1 mediator complex subunit MED18 [Toxoplasma gondii VEG]CEL71703.1 TPA: mediator complex subunit MED18 [Toxoplasma gondii VEG]|eukprot:XP_018638473.1 mediator complex subunit MED18 [Toxoplasma gondii ME49]
MALDESCYSYRETPASTPSASSLFDSWNEGAAYDAMAEACVLFQQREKKNETGEGGLKRGEGTYNEFSLQCLLQGEEGELQQKLDLLHRNAICFSDCWDDYEWTDMIFFQDNRSASNALDMKTSSSSSKQLSVRMYTAPDTMKGLCAVRSKEEGTLVKKAASRRKCNMVRVTEIVSSSGILDVLRCLGFRQITQVFVKARVYLSKVGTPNSAILLVQRHYSDPEYSSPLSLRKRGRAEPVGGWLIEAKARCEGDGPVAATTDFNLFNYAANFGPLLNLRRVEDNALAEAERELLHSSHPRRL